MNLAQAIQQMSTTTADDIIATLKLNRPGIAGGHFV
jgi:hypothetical protein